MELGTFSIVMRFAIDLETKALEIYNNKENEEYENIIIQYKKRIKRLNRLIRENTTEMILEPIDDFKSDPFEFQDDSTDVKVIEDLLASFYNEAAIKIQFMDEVAEIFEDFVEIHKKNINT